ncbi:chaperone protein dnaJ 8, chloroplastic-like [Prosopis cineraria]|uniref:chaperone protein dnaJ 8, chloroplastic-like n=1 Tax=Prosopis cineraria TaxID=364024 RepID=UPI00240F8FA6|nr:chaperone protein dnaJ 8, chloroplastic-like [Prosopis cineraria]
MFSSTKKKKSFESFIIWLSLHLSIMATIANAEIVCRQSLSSLNQQLRARVRLMHTRKINVVRISCCSSHSHTTVDPYTTLGIRLDASVPQVKRAFRKLAKKYHPDVCKGKDCDVQFKEINAAYEAVMSDLKGRSSAYESRYGYYEENDDEEARGMKNDPFNGFYEGHDNEHMKGRTDQHWDYRDEWIGWEVGNWIFYNQQQETDVDDMTCFEDTDKVRSELDSKSHLTH